MSWIRDRRSGGFVISAMEDVVELRDGITTFDTYWHNALLKFLTCFERKLHESVEFLRNAVLLKSTNFADFNPNPNGLI